MSPLETTLPVTPSRSAHPATAKTQTGQGFQAILSQENDKTKGKESIIPLQGTHAVTRHERSSGADRALSHELKAGQTTSSSPVADPPNSDEGIIENKSKQGSEDSHVGKLPPASSNSPARQSENEEVQLELDAAEGQYLLAEDKLADQSSFFNSLTNEPDQGAIPKIAEENSKANTAQSPAVISGSTEPVLLPVNISWLLPAEEPRSSNEVTPEQPTEISIISSSSPSGLVIAPFINSSAPGADQALRDSQNTSKEGFSMASIEKTDTENNVIPQQRLPALPMTSSKPSLPVEGSFLASAAHEVAKEQGVSALAAQVKTLQQGPHELGGSFGREPLKLAEPATSSKMPNREEAKPSLNVSEAIPEEVLKTLLLDPNQNLKQSGQQESQTEDQSQNPGSAPVEEKGLKAETGPFDVSLKQQNPQIKELETVNEGIKVGQQKLTVNQRTLNEQQIAEMLPGSQHTEALGASAHAPEIQSVSGSDNTSTPVLLVSAPRTQVAPERVVATFHPASDLSQAEKANVISQIIEKAHLISNKNNTELKIVLKPEFLGRVNLQASMVNNHLVATLQAESAAVKSLLESQLNVLQNALQDQGLPVAKVEVVQGDSLSFADFGGGHAHSQQNLGPQKSHFPFPNEPSLEVEMEGAVALTTDPPINAPSASRAINLMA